MLMVVVMAVDHGDGSGGGESNGGGGAGGVGGFDAGDSNE